MYIQYEYIDSSEVCRFNLLSSFLANRLLPTQEGTSRAYLINWNPKQPRFVTDGKWWLSNNFDWNNRFSMYWWWLRYLFEKYLPAIGFIFNYCNRDKDLQKKKHPVKNRTPGKTKKRNHRRQGTDFWDFKKAFNFTMCRRWVLRTGPMVKGAEPSMEWKLCRGGLKVVEISSIPPDGFNPLNSARTQQQVIEHRQTLVLFKSQCFQRMEWCDDSWLTGLSLFLEAYR